ncbi:hypothetical protein [Dongia sp.]|uniref:hypothetical protein n=1 Tax=Dongia sp. TaxID=1977262 RepID=UPI0035AE2817
MLQLFQASPLIQLASFRDRTLSASLAVNLLVATVMMATLVGLVTSISSVISALSGIVAGRLIDRFGAAIMVVGGLVAMVAGATGIALLPRMVGLVGYIAAVAILTSGYQLFQAANNTAVMAEEAAEQRGVTSGMLNLSRNLGLVSGASLMGAVFAVASGASDIATAAPEAVAMGLRITFLVPVS